MDYVKEKRSMDTLISVIVPVYNVEKYLPRCIESILRQTYQNFELLLIDDGSPDRAGKICDSYAKKDARIRVVHKENAGVSSARNKGLDLAKGEYIAFIDSDDWVREDYLEKLLAPMLKYDVQMVVGGTELRDIDFKKTYMPAQQLDLQTPDEDVAWEFFIEKPTLSRGPCFKLYVKSIIEKYHIRFNETITWGEDTIFLHEYWKKAGKIFIISDCLYYYNRLVSSSAMTRVHPKMADFRIAICASFRDLMDNSGLKDDAKKQIVTRFKLPYFLDGIKEICLTTPNPIEKIEEFYNAFLPWEDVDGYGFEQYALIKEKQLEELCERYKPKKRKWIKRLLLKLYYGSYVKVKGFYLERRRDGLKSFKQWRADR